MTMMKMEMKIMTTSNDTKIMIVIIIINIAKGTTDPRVEFISQDHSSQILDIFQF